MVEVFVEMDSQDGIVDLIYVEWLGLFIDWEVVSCEIKWFESCMCMVCLCYVGVVFEDVDYKIWCGLDKVLF